MASIKISDLHSNLSVSIDDKEFIGAVENAITRALDTWQLQDIKGGLNTSTTKVTPLPIFVGIIAAL